MTTNGNTFGKSSIKGNKWRPFKMRRLRKSAISKLWRSKRVILLVVLLALSATALVSLGVWRAVKPTSGLARGAAATGPANVASGAGSAVNASEPPATPNPPLTKLREYVYAGGRLLTSEEKSCVPALSPSSASLPQGGGTGSVSVSTASGCNWVGAGNADWITITSGSSGAGNGSVDYTVAANSGAQRNSTISINGQAFTIITG